MSDDRTYDVVESDEVAIDSTGDKFTWTPATPVRIIRAGVTGTSSYTHGSGAVIALDKNASDGDGSYTRGDADIGEITVNSGFDQGLVNYIKPDERLEMVPGDQLIIEVTQAANAGDGVVWVEYQKLPFQSGYGDPDKDLLRNATEV